MLRDILLETLKVLEETADTCARWAGESARGGWSVHQVSANLETAQKLRAQADALHDTINTLDNAAALGVNVEWN